MSLPIVLAGVALVLVAGFTLWACRRGGNAHATPRQTKSSGNALQWGVRIESPDRKRACKSVQPLLGKEFLLARKPQIPLPDCSFSHDCACKYVPLFDKRKGERRESRERRVAQRFEPENKPRRTGRDRRKDRDIGWD